MAQDSSYWVWYPSMAKWKSSSNAQCWAKSKARRHGMYKDTSVGTRSQSERERPRFNVYTLSRVHTSLVDSYIVWKNKPCLFLLDMFLCLFLLPRSTVQISEITYTITTCAPSYGTIYTLQNCVEFIVSVVYDGGPCLRLYSSWGRLNSEVKISSPQSGINDVTRI
jgi:hypothetical protein